MLEMLVVLFITGTLPEKENVVTELEVCRNGPDGWCDDTKTVKTKKCNGTYLFELVDLDGCAEAYCLGKYVLVEVQASCGVCLHFLK